MRGEWRLLKYVEELKQSLAWTLASTRRSSSGHWCRNWMLYQEYPPGITLVPMKSKTLQPFRTTNLVVVRATNGAGESTYSDVFACGDALLLDPECSSQVHAEARSQPTPLPVRAAGRLPAELPEWGRGQGAKKQAHNGV
ncbi:hypothetical protein C2845_PM13G26150 [Panicum miliaceum]|uniref:Uncharacterized protein n=1 Tax=Panicum miliaceum TaxID=4540 RepID=A0A3L6RII9_PANMI|nr:hypothetical protein C2845_PM13G26150 [Panicum miliaceum]